MKEVYVTQEGEKRRESILRQEPPLREEPKTREDFMKSEWFIFLELELQFEFELETQMSLCTRNKVHLLLKDVRWRSCAADRTGLVVDCDAKFPVQFQQTCRFHWHRWDTHQQAMFRKSNVKVSNANVIRALDYIVFLRKVRSFRIITF